MLIPSTVPRELNQRIITEMNNPEWRSLFQESLEQIENFEHMLNFRQYIACSHIGATTNTGNETS